MPFEDASCAVRVQWETSVPQEKWQYLLLSKVKIINLPTERLVNYACT